MIIIDLSEEEQFDFTIWSSSLIRPETYYVIINLWSELSQYDLYDLLDLI